MRSYSGVGVIASCLWACGSVIVVDDAGPDAGLRDGGGGDAGSAHDSGHIDAGDRRDGGSERDAGAPRDGGLDRDGGISRDSGAERDAGPATPIVTIVKMGAGDGNVSSIPAGLNCGALCTAAFAAGTNVELVAVADVYSTFAGWSGPCTGGGSCSFTATEAVTVTARFDVRPTVETSNTHSCAVNFEGRVRCWGSGGSGKLGHDNTTNIGDGAGPTILSAGDVPVGVSVVDVALGGSHTCALASDRSVRCWGFGGNGALGYGTNDNVGDGAGPSIIAAGPVPIGGRVSRIAAGFEHTCAILETGTLRCWGDNDQGQLGYDHTNAIGNATGAAIVDAGDIDVGGSVVDVCAAFLSTCAVLTNGQVRCWGRSFDGHLGYGMTANVGNGTGPSIASIGGVFLGGTAIAVGCGSTHTCALLASGGVRCWGGGVGGQLGYGDTSNVGDFSSNEIPGAGDVPIGGLVEQLSLGQAHSCARLVGGDVRCWGAGLHGRLGHDSTENIGDSAARSIVGAGSVPIGFNVTHVSATNGATTCAVSALGTVRCWGHGSGGKLGHNSVANIGDGIGSSIQSAGDVMVW